MRESYDLKELIGWKNLLGAIMRLHLPWRYIVYDTIGMRAYGVLPQRERDYVLRSLKRAWRDCADCEYGVVGEYSTSVTVQSKCSSCFDDPARPNWKLNTPNAAVRGAAEPRTLDGLVG